jgi:TctA family transporter
MGGDVATFISYGQAKQLSKDPDRFGNGAVEGVIAAESANDAKEGGALLTTLAFGIPGSAIWAIMLGALLTMGLTPGPRMFEEQLGLSFGMLYVIAFASLIATIVTTVAIPLLGKVTVLPSHQVVAVVVPIVFIGAYAANEDVFDILLLLLFTALGVVMKRFGYNRPAFLLAFILGFLFELELFKALNAYGPFFFLRPISFAILLITVGLFVYAMLPRRQKETEKV